MKRNFIKRIMIVLFATVLVSGYSFAQDMQKKTMQMKHKQDCKCEKCIVMSKKMTAKQKAMKKHQSMMKHPADCKCGKCSAMKTKMKNMKKHSTNNTCNKSQMATKPMNKKCGADCTCTKCMEKKQNHSTTKIWNKYCPVGKEKVAPSVKTAMYKDKIIGFCCSGCKEKFLKNPEKYLGNLSADGKSLVK